MKDNSIYNIDYVKAGKGIDLNKARINSYGRNSMFNVNSPCSCCIFIDYLEFILDTSFLAHLVVK